ncbi:citrate/tricarballylate utilization protein [Limimaricola variabilis]|uniref:Citrate/tricarballylate utilization protein n=1 Tax=Limimaricola variabilis TaxID=1492771 RepID=A0ABR6HMK5_9RHOB|nr:citrate/tricarballylate utilization protein [Limimaricola variabilis]
MQMQPEFVEEARRQAEICNACRYCEGYCAVFPALQAERAFAEADLTQLANLCHNCRNCYHACQYTAPHEFDLNLPKALAELRHDSWDTFAWPGGLARAFQRSGTMIAVAFVLGFAALFLAARALPAEGEGFYAVLSHNAMVAIFAPAFLLPLASLSVSLRRYWAHVGGGRITLGHLRHAFGSAAKMRNLAGGHGDGCNFEEEDRFSQARRHAHTAVLVGFLLCFASTSSGTVLHYVFDAPAPYGFWSLPKLLGVPGGLLLGVGALWLAHLKLKADPELGAPRAWGGEMGFVLLLAFVAWSGLALWLLRDHAALPMILALHLGGVLAFFLLMPFTKMAHGFYRLAALVRDAQRREAS